MIDIDDAKRKYYAHKHSAKKRSIGWEFTFETWISWWGDDFHKRGVGIFKLQMQRNCDTGPYSPSNTSKGYPKQNGSTFAKMNNKRKADKVKEQHESFLNALMWAQ